MQGKRIWEVPEMRRDIEKKIWGSVRLHVGEKGAVSPEHLGNVPLTKAAGLFLTAAIRQGLPNFPGVYRGKS
jgi:hypothetical protein